MARAPLDLQASLAGIDEELREVQVELDQLRITLGSVDRLQEHLVEIDALLAALRELALSELLP